MLVSAKNGGGREVVAEGTAGSTTFRQVYWDECRSQGDWMMYFSVFKPGLAVLPDHQRL